MSVWWVNADDPIAADVGLLDADGWRSLDPEDNEEEAKRIESGEWAAIAVLTDGDGAVLYGPPKAVWHQLKFVLGDLELLHPKVVE